MRNYNKFYQKFAADIVRRSGIARPTVEALLPHVFDEIRYQLTEGTLCVPIEGFGTFYVKDVPEHEFLYHRGDKREIHTVPAKKVVKFAPTRNLRLEAEAGKFDANRRSFIHYPQDPKVSCRGDLRYRPENYDRSTGLSSRPIYKHRTDTDDTD